LFLQKRKEVSVLVDLVKKSRSYRRFEQDFEISRSMLLQLIELAQFSPTGMNLQPLKFYLSNSPEDNARIFSTLAWAGYLKDWGGPIDGERPSAYIIILGDKSIKTNFGIDHGIAAQSILLGATEMGLGGCMIASVQRDVLCSELNITDQYEILLVLALGKPIEKVILEDLDASGNTRYYRDELGGHHVPKRKLEDLVIN